MLLGRRDERMRIERLLDDARRGRSGSLVVRGEAGIGKTTLLRYARDLGEAMTVVTATGVEAEAELEYSGLLELTRPLLHVLDELPPHQADAMREALGLSAPTRRDRFAIGAALLSLLAAAAEERPLLVLVDDAQWLDHASSDAVRFASRRLFADCVAFLVAVRAGGEGAFETSGFDVLDLGGLGVDEVGSLLARSGVETLSRDTLEHLQEATRGNPLALTEAAEQLAPEELAAWRAGAEPLPVGTAVGRAFARSAESLPAETRRALVLAAVASVPDVDVLARALARLELELGSLEPAEDSGLVSLLRGVVAFRHPLVRSAIHHAASPSDRRAAHAAFADALAESGLEDRRAWHLAAAALGPDEEIAGALDSVAERSRERSGHAAAAAALEHAARLSPDEATRRDRLVRAAEASWAGGSPPKAAELVDEALAISHDATSRSRALALRGRIEREAGLQPLARDMLLEAAALAEEEAPEDAAAMLHDAANTMYFGGDVEGSLRVAEHARELAPRDESLLDGRADLLVGWALSHAGRDEEAGVALTRAVELLLAGDEADLRRLLSARLALDILERDAEGDALTTRIIAGARGDGPLALARALEQATRFDVRAGRWRRAVANGEEGLEIASALGHGFDISSLLVLLARVDAARGEDERCRERLDRTLAVAHAHGLETLADEVLTVRGLLDLGLGRLPEAVESLERVARISEQRGLFGRDITPEPDLVEALLALGRLDEARRWLDAFAGRASRASPQWGAALVARCRAMLEEVEFEELFLEALGLHLAVPDRFQEARTLLAFGERLRRAGRRRDARDRLRQALDLLEELEATPWTERARAELRATGERLRRARAAPGDELTPQELQVALQVAEGKTNKEAAAALFLSPKTIEFHLASVYRKLGVASRRELIKRVSAQGVEALAPV
jgi:DNA-binding CsgD family transcriptional regulator